VSDDFQVDLGAIAAIDAVPTILNVVSNVTGMGFAAIARVTDKRWICLASNDIIGFGLRPGGELQIETTICHEVRQARSAVVIDHVSEDEQYRKHRTPEMYGFQSYISMPIFLKDGSFYGTLCAIDPKPAKLKNSGVVGMFRLFADLIGIHLDSALQLATAEARLADAEATSELRDQFIAVLGHDLRNPLASIAAGANLLQRTPLDPKARSITELMQKSVVRMSALIDNVMDFARGRLGGGIAISRTATPLAPVLQQIVDELRTAHPSKTIETDFDLSRPVSADREKTR
jgi:signal transduction histidine kinase